MNPGPSYQVSFNPKARRVTEAKLGQLFSGPRKVGWEVATALVFVGGLALKISGVNIGLTVVGIGLILAMLTVWGVWYLSRLTPAVILPNATTVALDQVLPASVVYKLKNATSPRDIWRLLEPSWRWRFMITRLGLDAKLIDSQLSQRADDLEPVWQNAIRLALSGMETALYEGILTVSLLYSLPNLEAEILAPVGLNTDDLLTGLNWQERVAAFIDNHATKQTGGIGRDWTFGFTPLLNQLGTNISQQIETGAIHLNRQIHDKEIGQLVQGLKQPTNNSAALIGETGVGKTTLVYSLANRLLDKDFPEPNLRFRQVVALNAPTLLAHAPNQGDIEGLMLGLMGEAARAKNVILFFDDAQVFFGEQTGEVNLVNILQPILEQSVVRMILALRPADWQRLTATSPQLTSLLNYQVISPPDRADTLVALEDQALSIEAQTGATITYQAIREAYNLGERYVTDQAFPGRAASLLAAAASKFPQNGMVTAGSVQQSVEANTGVPVAEASPVEKGQLLHLEDALHQRMVDQEPAVKAVANALRRARAGVKDERRPVGSFLFLGPTGVGKTELARALAAVYFGGVQKLIQIDMTEYASEGALERLLADSSDPVVAQPFLDQVRKQPFSVVVLDEVEKAHPKVINLLLQMLEEGRLTDRSGRAVSFRDAIVIATSNAGADDIRARIEQGQQLEQFGPQFIDNLINRKAFLPELLNRFDEIVLFRPLNQAELGQIVQLLMREVNAELKNKQVQVVLSQAAAQWLVTQGNDPRLGARPLRRMIQQSVENVVAKRLLDGSLKPGMQATLDIPDLQRS